MRIILSAILFILFFPFSSFSQLRLPAVLSSGMVLQQSDSVSIWGWGNNSETMSITGSWDNKTYTTVVSNQGSWNRKIKTPAAGGPFTLTISRNGQDVVLTDVMIGEVWLCSGQSNMEWGYSNGARFIKEEFPTCYNRNIRFYQVPRASSEYPQDDLKANWLVCDSNSLKAFSAVGYFFGKKLQQDLNIPIGLINASWGGTPAETWTPAESISGDPVLKDAAASLKEVPWGPVKPALLYNGMLSPIKNFNIAGAIWYQGEANTSNNSVYAQLLTTMIDAWRKKWNKEFPFYYVQIAPFTYGRKNEGALVQEQQTKAMSHPKTGMVVVNDLIDSVSNIHPSDKREVGKRLANWALGDTYHKNIPEYKSPKFRNSEIVKNKLVIQFDNAPTGLMATNKTITGFYVSGDKEEWLPADAKIENDKIILSNKALKNPVYARYGFGNTLIGNVFNKEGLPVVPFRTDNWVVDQSPEKRN